VFNGTAASSPHVVAVTKVARLGALGVTVAREAELPVALTLRAGGAQGRQDGRT
jgi:hypothetical protein